MAARGAAAHAGAAAAGAGASSRRVGSTGLLKATRTRCALDTVSPVYTAAEADPLASADFVSFWRRGFSVAVVSDTPEECVFELVGVDAPIANALRRILLSEVPTMAIETVFIQRNTSIIQDEVLAHRLGLVPLAIDPRLFGTVKPGEEATDLNTAVFHLSAEGEARAPGDLGCGEGETDSGGGSFTKVYSSALKWEPQGNQVERLPVPAGPVHDDILLAKLAPGQVITLEAHAVKGLGRDHAKFSPVATAAYRLLPSITLSAAAPFVGAEAEALARACPMGVFDIEDVGGGVRRAVAKRPRDCTVCRECLRPQGGYSDWGERVVVERVNSHFIFTVESTGGLPARDLVVEALRVLADKARAVLGAMDDAAAAAAVGSSGGGGGGDMGAAGGASLAGALGGGAPMMGGGAQLGGLPWLPSDKVGARTIAAMRSVADERE